MKQAFTLLFGPLHGTTAWLETGFTAPLGAMRGFGSGQYRRPPHEAKLPRDTLVWYADDPACANCGGTAYVMDMFPGPV